MRIAAAGVPPTWWPFHADMAGGSFGNSAEARGVESRRRCLARKATTSFFGVQVDAMRQSRDTAKRMLSTGDGFVAIRPGLDSAQPAI